jgi:putative membrane protein
MTNPPTAPQPGTTNTVPRPSANGTAPTPPAAAPSAAAPSAAAPTPPAAAPSAAAPSPRPRRTRVSSARTALIAGAAVLVVLLIFIIQNTHAVQINFLGAHVRLSLAVALLLAAVAGILLMAAAGTARITQLRMAMRRERRRGPRS